MRIPVPSFRTQIVLLVLFLVINSALFFRNYFLDSLQSYTRAVDALEVNSRIENLYQEYASRLPEEVQDQFKQDLEQILVTEHQKALARGLFRSEISLYSLFIFVFLTLAVLLLFFISFNLITSPLKRLQTATENLSRGDWSIRVRESRFSPLNDLIISFNRMVGELEENRRKLLQAERELVWREMARILAHEIKNPLTPIKLSLERLEHRFRAGTGDFAPVFDSATAVIHEEINNLQTLAREFSQFARLPEAQFAPCDLNRLLREISAPYQEQIAITLFPALDLPLIRADRSQLKQVFANLIQNSIQSLTGAGTLDITITHNHDLVTVTLADNGPGIPADMLPKIFEPYFTTREKGTGLGLAIVKRILELHAGNIHVASQPGKGTTFTISLPAQQPPHNPET